MSFFLYSVTGNEIFHEADFYLRFVNSLIISGILAINHRVSVNDLNISKDIVSIEPDLLFSPSTQDIEVLPLNFVLNEELPLSILKKIYKEGAYVIVYTGKFVIKLYAKENDVYLIEKTDTLELENIKKLKLLR